MRKITLLFLIISLIITVLFFIFAGVISGLAALIITIFGFCYFIAPNRVRSIACVLSSTRTRRLWPYHYRSNRCS